MPAHVPRAIRLTFVYAGGQVTLQSSTRLEMRALPAHETTGHEHQAGFWVELRDTGDRVMYRRVLHNPVRQDVELYPASPSEQFSRRTIDQPRGSFDVVVPEVPGAQAVALFGSLPGPGLRSEAPARLLGRFPLPAADGDRR